MRGLHSATFREHSQSPGTRVANLNKQGAVFTYGIKVGTKLGQHLTTSRTPSNLCVNYSEVPHVREMFNSPRECCRHWSAPTSSLLKWDLRRTAQQFNSRRAERRGLSPGLPPKM